MKTVGKVIRIIAGVLYLLSAIAIIIILPIGVFLNDKKPVGFTYYDLISTVLQAIFYVPVAFVLLKNKRSLFIPVVFIAFVNYDLCIAYGVFFVSNFKLVYNILSVFSDLGVLIIVLGVVWFLEKPANIPAASSNTQKLKDTSTSTDLPQQNELKS